jgi:hypothetical protein
MAEWGTEALEKVRNGMGEYAAESERRQQQREETEKAQQ